MSPRTNICPVLLVVSLSACADLTVPALDQSPASGTDTPKPAASTATQPARPQGRAAARPTGGPADAQQVQASHILIGYQDAMRSKATRTKEEAKKLAEQILVKAKRGDDFAALAKEHSEGPSARRGGALGRFTRRSMVKPFADAAFALKPGDVSDLVETRFGFHIIKRVK